MAVLLMSTTIKIKKSQTIETGIRERKFLTFTSENINFLHTENETMDVKAKRQVKPILTFCPDVTWCIVLIDK